MQAVTVKILQHFQKNIKTPFPNRTKKHNSTSILIDNKLPETWFPIVFPAVWGDYHSQRKN